MRIESDVRTNPKDNPRKCHDLRSNLKHILEWDHEGVHFLDRFGTKLNEVKDWDMYRVATDIIEEVNFKKIPNIMSLND